MENSPVNMIGNESLLHWMKGKDSAEKYSLLKEISDQMKEMNYEDDAIVGAFVKLKLKTIVRIDNMLYPKISFSAACSNKARATVNVEPQKREENVPEEDINSNNKHVEFKQIEHRETDNVASVKPPSTINSHRPLAKRAGEPIEEGIKRKVKKISQQSGNVKTTNELPLDSNDTNPVFVNPNYILPPPFLNENCITPVLREIQVDCTSSTSQPISQMPLANAYSDTQLIGLVEDSQVLSDSTVSSSNNVIEHVASAEGFDGTDLAPEIQRSTSNCSKTEISVPEIKSLTSNIKKTEILLPEIKCSTSNISEPEILVPNIKCPTSNTVLVSNGLNVYLKYFHYFPVPEDIQLSLSPLLEELHDTKQDCVREFYNIYLMYLNDKVYGEVNKAAEILHLSISDLQRRKDRLERSLKLSSEHLKAEEKKRANSEYCEMVALRGVAFQQVFVSLMEQIPYFELCVVIALFFRVTQALFKISIDNIKYINDIWQLMATLLKSDDFKLTPSLDFFLHVETARFHSFYDFSKRCLVSLYQSGYTDLVSNTILSLSHLPPCPINLGQVDKNTAHHNPAMIKPECNAGIIEKDEKEVPEEKPVPLCVTPFSKALQQVSAQQRARCDEISAKCNTDQYNKNPLQNIRSPSMQAHHKAENSTRTFNSDNVNAGIQQNNTTFNHQNQMHVQHIPSYYHGKEGNNTLSLKTHKTTPSNIQAPLQKQQAEKQRTATNIELLRRLSSYKNDILKHNQLSGSKEHLEMPTHGAPNTRGATQDISKVSGTSVDPRYKSAACHSVNVNKTAECSKVNVDPRCKAAECSNINVGSPLALSAQCSVPGCNLRAALKCSLCFSAFYCTKNCQTDHWYHSHHKECSRSYSGT